MLRALALLFAFATCLVSSAAVEKRTLATIYSHCKVANTAAITFDDGPYIFEQDLIPILAQYGAKSTFFLNGNNWACIYDDQRITALRALQDAGHEFGSHTWSHDDLTTLTWDQIHDQMWKVELALLRIVGVYPALFRPPYGSYNDLALTAIAARNQSAILWDFDCGDSTGSTVAQSESLYDTLASKHPNNILALDHSTYNSTVHQVIPHALKVLSQQGYKFVTVSQCLGIPAYQYTTARSQKDSSWTC